MKYGILYEIRNKLNNKRYIGITTQTIKKRWYGHIQNLK